MMLLSSRPRGGRSSLTPHKKGTAGIDDPSAQRTVNSAQRSGLASSGSWLPPPWLSPSQRGVAPVAVSAALRACMTQHPVLGARVTRGPKTKTMLEIPNPQTPVSEADNMIVAFLEAPAELAEAAGKGDRPLLKLLVELELNTPFPDFEGSSPVFQAKVFSPPGSLPPWLLLRLHHACFDRVSALNVGGALVHALCSPSAGPSAGSPTQMLPPPITDGFPLDLKPKGTLSKIVDGIGFVAKAQGCALLPFSAAPDKCDSRKHAFRTQLVPIRLSIDETQTFLAACKAKGCSVFAAEAAAVLLATAGEKKLGSKAESYQMTCIVGCREKLAPPQDPTSLGLFDAGVPIKQSVSEATAFWDLALALSDAAEKDVSKRRHFSEMAVLDSLFSTVLSNPGLTPSGSFRTALLTAFFDAPVKLPWVASAPSSTGQVAVVDSLGPVASCHGVGPCVSIPDVILPSGELEILLSYAAPLYSEASMAAFAAKVYDVIIGNSNGQ